MGIKIVPSGVTEVPGVGNVIQGFGPSSPLPASTQVPDDSPDQAITAVANTALARQQADQNASPDQAITASASAAALAKQAASNNLLKFNTDLSNSNSQQLISRQFKDLRVTLKPLNPGDIFKGGDLLKPLQDIGGILFPYTPSISYNQTVSYQDLQLVHSNTDYPAYTRTPSVTISITGKFTVQSQQEGLYALGCLHFLRVASKSYFGEADAKDGKAGLPPPILVLAGYGSYMFNQLRVVVKSHSYTLDDSADGVVIKSSGGVARLPAMFSLTCELMVVQTPQRMRKQFSFDKFASGALMQSTNVGWI